MSDKESSRDLSPRDLKELLVDQAMKKIFVEVRFHVVVAEIMGSFTFLL